MSGCTKQLINKIECKHGATRCVVFNKDGNYCISSGSDNRITLWNPYTGKNLKTYCGHAGEVTEVAATADNACIASASSDKLVLLWDVFTGVSINRWRRHVAGVNAVCINDESNIIISGGMDKHVYLWDRRSKSISPVQNLTEAKDSILSVDSHKWFILTSSVDKCVRIYDIRKGKMIEDCIGCIPVYSKLADACHLYITNCDDNTLKLFDNEDGNKLNEYGGHKIDNYRIGCSFYGTDKIMSGSASGNTSGGGMIHTWNLLSGQCVERIKVPSVATSGSSKINSVVHSLSVHPTEPDKYLLAAAGDCMFLYQSHSLNDE